MYRLIAALLLFLGLAFAVIPARAQASCAVHDELTAYLEKKFGERPVSWGLSSNGFLVEVFSSDKGSWTIVLTNPFGISCIRAASDGWSDVPAREANERTDDQT